MKQAIFNAKDNGVTEILLYGVIGEDFFGDGIDAKSFREQVKAVRDGSINLRINSPGGSVIDGAAMMNALDQFKGRIEVDVDGLAASAASVVAMAGDHVRVASNGLMMIHNPVTLAMGGADEMRRTADLLDKVKEQILDAYGRKSSESRDRLAAMMDAETWFTGQEAVAVGLADETTQPVRVAAMCDYVRLFSKLGFKHPPKSLDAVEVEAWEETRRRRAIAASL